MDTADPKYDDEATYDDGWCAGVLRGCTNSTARNYRAAATVSDGSCWWRVAGCLDDGYLDYDHNATVHDVRLCDEPRVVGCIDPAAANYRAAANVNGTCTFYGCTNRLSTRYDPRATVDDGTCGEILAGCMEPSLRNYRPAALVDDGSCARGGCIDNSSAGYNVAATYDDGSCMWVVGGCTDSHASNYRPAATHDDGECAFGGCADPADPAYDPIATYSDGTCTTEGGALRRALAGRALSSHTCFDMSTWRSSSNLSCVDYEARLYCAGGTLGAGWDPAWGVLADWGVNGTHAGTACCACGGGVHRRRGCMSTVALNYDPAADVGDASCVFARKGCTDRAAMNYQPNATQNDDSCVYAAPWLHRRGRDQPRRPRGGGRRQLHLLSERCLCRPDRRRAQRGARRRQ